MKTKTFLLIVITMICCSLSAKNYYVATDGLDTNSGTITAPFATLNKAQSLVTAGDTVYFRGGT